jgi:hypothetical protein
MQVRVTRALKAIVCGIIVTLLAYAAQSLWTGDADVAGRCATITVSYWITQS